MNIWVVFLDRFLKFIMFFLSTRQSFPRVAWSQQERCKGVYDCVLTRHPPKGSTLAQHQRLHVYSLSNCWTPNRSEWPLFACFDELLKPWLLFPLPLAPLLALLNKNKIGEAWKIALINTKTSTAVFSATREAHKAGPHSCFVCFVFNLMSVRHPKSSQRGLTFTKHVASETLSQWSFLSCTQSTKYLKCDQKITVDIGKGTKNWN